MRRPFRGDMPVLLTLPLHFDLRLRGRERRWRRIAVAVLVILGLALVAAGVLKPAKAETEALRVPSLHAHAAMPAPTFAIGDVLVLEHGDAAVTYEVTGLDLVDGRRAEIALDASDDDVVVLVARRQSEAAHDDGWRYVATARRIPARDGVVTARVRF